MGSVGRRDASAATTVPKQLGELRPAVAPVVLDELTPRPTGGQMPAAKVVIANDNTEGRRRRIGLLRHKGSVCSYPVRPAGISEPSKRLIDG